MSEPHCTHFLRDSIKQNLELIYKTETRVGIQEHGSQENTLTTPIPILQNGAHFPVIYETNWRTNSTQITLIDYQTLSFLQKF